MTISREVEESPIRMQRDVERKNLEELNGRLEQYIMTQRRKDASREAWEAELKAVQTSAAQALADTTAKYETWLRQMRLQRDEHASAREELKVRVSRMEETISRLKEQIANEKKYENELSTRVSNMSAQLEARDALVVKLQENVRKLEQSLKGSHRGFVSMSSTR